MTFPRLVFAPLLLALPVFVPATAVTGRDSKPLRVLSAKHAHGHAGGFLRQAESGVVTITGVWEPDDDVRDKYRPNAKLAGVTRNRTLDEAVTNSGAEAVWAFSDTQAHLEIERAVAPRGASVMAEKPLTLSWAAAEMAAQKGAISRTEIDGREWSHRHRHAD